MVFVTLSVTYVINVFQGVVEKRSFMSSVRGVGKQSESFVTTGRDGEDFGEHGPSIDTFVSQLSTIASQHNAYPSLHYYRSAGQRYSIPIIVAIFDDALTVLRFGAVPDDRPNEPLLETGRLSVEDYLKSVYTLPIESATQPSPAPDLARIRKAKIPTVTILIKKVYLDILPIRQFGGSPNADSVDV